MPLTTPSSLLGQLLGEINPVEPYPYQTALAKALASGRNVVVSAPTGSGKTWAALLPYLVAHKGDQPTWDRVLYALPLRSLASSLWASTLKGCKSAGFSVTSADRRDRSPGADELAITIQTGEQRLDPFLTGDVIFLTIDQLLGGYLNTPLSLAEKLANINAGALLGSLIVLDEVHLLDSERSLATAIEMANRLRGYAQVAVMTATLSDHGLEQIASLLDATVICTSEDELLSIPTQRDKLRTWRWSEQPLSADAVLRRHGGGRSLVICNSVTRAQSLFLELRAAIEGSQNPPELQLLHSRFYRDDRRAVEGTLPDRFGPGDGVANQILVATQVVEAGMNISADELHTEACAANSLIQRAGRCARFAAPRNVGAVTVYELERTSDGQRRLGPYRDQAELVEAAISAVQARHGQTLGFADEQAFLDETLTEHEDRVFAKVSAARLERSKAVAVTMEFGDRSQVRNLIRDVASIGVILHDAPEQVDLADGPELLSVPRTALFGLRESFDAQAAEGEWAAKIPVEPSEDDENVIGGWQPVSFRQLQSVPWVVALHPALGSYDSMLGLLLGQAGQSKNPPLHDPPTFLRPCYHRETFQEHAQRTLAACRRQSIGTRRAAEQLDEQLGLPKGTCERLAQIASALHDTGKLSVKWQAAITTWQRFKDTSFSGTEPLAHSDYQPSDWKASQAPQFQRPPHAMEGALALTPVLHSGLAHLVSNREGIELGVRCIATAIGRHHSGHASSLKPYSLVNSATQNVRAVSELLGLGTVAPPMNAPASLSCERFAEQVFVHPTSQDSAKWLPLYWFIVRRLRLADQTATAEIGGT